MQAVGERTPLLVVLEDLQWADESTLRALSHLVANRPPGPFLLLLTQRLAPVASSAAMSSLLSALGRAHGVHLPLAGLEDDEVAGLLAAVTGTRAHPRVVREVARRTDGNPFVVVELARHDQLTGELPSSVRDVVAHCLRGLPPGTLALLGGAALLDRTFDADPARPRRRPPARARLRAAGPGDGRRDPARGGRRPVHVRPRGRPGGARRLPHLAPPGPVARELRPGPRGARRPGPARPTGRDGRPLAGRRLRVHRPGVAGDRRGRRGGHWPTGSPTRQPGCSTRRPGRSTGTGRPPRPTYDVSATSRPSSRPSRSPPARTPAPRTTGRSERRDPAGYDPPSGDMYPHRRPKPGAHAARGVGVGQVAQLVRASA